MPPIRQQRSRSPDYDSYLYYHSGGELFRLGLPDEKLIGDKVCRTIRDYLIPLKVEPSYYRV